VTTPVNVEEMFLQLCCTPGQETFLALPQLATHMTPLPKTAQLYLTTYAS